MVTLFAALVLLMQTIISFFLLHFFAIISAYRYESEISERGRCYSRYLNAAMMFIAEHKLRNRNLMRKTLMATGDCRPSRWQQHQIWQRKRTLLPAWALFIAAVEILRRIYCVIFIPHSFLTPQQSCYYILFIIMNANCSALCGYKWAVTPSSGISFFFVWRRRHLNEQQDRNTFPMKNVSVLFNALFWATILYLARASWHHSLSVSAHTHTRIP